MDALVCDCGPSEAAREPARGGGCSPQRGLLSLAAGAALEVVLLPGWGQSWLETQLRLHSSAGAVGEQAAA